jgi:hypothetical protein
MIYPSLALQFPLLDPAVAVASQLQSNSNFNSGAHLVPPAAARKPLG